MSRAPHHLHPANLWQVKQSLHRHLLDQLDFDAALSLMTASPSPSAASLAPTAAAGCARCPPGAATKSVKQTFLGLRGHLRVCWPGVIVEAHLAPANIADQAIAPDLLDL
ncbi:hypothetical protein [Nonomuraea sp. NPDC049400]|uniref:hypothetical protein n=1 Tax=Nonomuraea sp. NPDC049400 TaxID=3364352 RepID=UPI00378B8809